MKGWVFPPMFFCKSREECWRVACTITAAILLPNSSSVGYFPNWNGSLQGAKDYAEELLNDLFASIGDTKLEAVYCRRATD